MSFREVFEGISMASEAMSRREEGDYEVDGILYCGKCNTAKQGYLKLPWGTIKQAFLCDCAAQSYDAEQEERRRRARMDRIASLRSAGFPDREMRDWTFDSDDSPESKLSKTAHRYTEHFSDMLQDGKGLIMYGGIGVGKTFYAAAICNELITRGYPCMVTSFPRIISMVSSAREGKQDIIDSLNRYDLLVIDDFAAERSTEYADEIVYNVIDARCKAKLPLIVTTNLTAEQLKHPSDVRQQRTYSRLYEMCIPVLCEGDDRRKKTLRDDHNRFKDLLGL